MSRHSDVLAIPERSYLSAQAAATIRRAVEEGRWHEFLPSERRLCDILRVSRPTIRAAVHLLAKEGWLDIRQGRRSRLLAGPGRRRGPKSRLVVLVSTTPAWQMHQSIYQSIAEMRTHLAEHGFTTEILTFHARGVTARRHKIEAFMRQNSVLCWVLVSLDKALQLWFSDRSIPALVLGSCHPGVTLPSLDVDYRSVCRHAAGVFLSKGHRQLALIVRDFGLAGDLASEAGFCEAIARHSPKDSAHGQIVRHNGTVSNLHAKLDNLFHSARPPTALLVAQPQHIIWVLTYLLKHGINVPDSVSVISRDREILFDDAIAHYRYESDAFARRLSHLMLQMVGQGFLAPEPSLVFPRFCPAGTVRELK